MLTNTHKLGIVIALMFATVLFFLSYGIEKVDANAFGFTRSVTSSATTTYNSLSLGVGTTTVTFPDNCSVQSRGTDSAILNLFLNASSTAPIIGYRLESSQDGIDWFPSVPSQTAATTTASFYSENTLTLSTSTVAAKGAGGTGSINRVMASVSVPTPTRCTRAVLYGVSGSGSLYAEIIGKQQIQ